MAKENPTMENLWTNEGSFDVRKDNGKSKSSLIYFRTNETGLNLNRRLKFDLKIYIFLSEPNLNPNNQNEVSFLSVYIHISLSLDID